MRPMEGESIFRKEKISERLRVYVDRWNQQRKTYQQYTMWFL